MQLVSLFVAHSSTWKSRWLTGAYRSKSQTSKLYVSHLSLTIFLLQARRVSAA